ncbi:hypothetical protein E3N88_32893 [Mikania micrantha]|uniref:Protein kinase domain-containing protein n=1 Tax=Mikania micrantha TaxID=192012 RepID=A0A5N6MAF6_9ASTR|nr:hypothetical protein E3N88_32893 [Mikania micrantha]
MNQKINTMTVKKVAMVIRSWKMRLKMQLQQHVKGLQLPVSDGDAAYSVPLSVFSGKQTPNPLLRQWVNHLRTTVRCSNRPSRLSTGQLFAYNSVKGTFGYIDPNYFLSGKLTRKSDVYSFGIVLFEVLTGKQALDPTFDEDRPSLAVWAQHHFKERRINDIIDHRMVGQISKKCLKAFASIAVQCLHNQPKLRPTMAEVVVKLDSILLREREHLGSGVDDGRFINKVRYFLKGKADLVSTIKNDNVEAFHLDSFETIYRGWVDELTYAPTKSGVGLAVYVRTRHFGTTKLDLKPEEFNHPNLVKLLGYYLNNQKLSCVYERVPGQTLDELLFGDAGTSLSWCARLKIAVGAAQGLTFLHQKVHPAYRQFKTNCILVDMDGNARLWDFEVNYSFLDPYSYSFEGGAHYAAPEWYRYHADTAKSFLPLDTDSFKRGEHYSFKRGELYVSHGLAMQNEIYSFGVVLLEMLSGMEVHDWNRPLGEENLAKWTAPLLAHEANFGMIMDKQLQDNNLPPKGAFIFAKLVSNCLQPAQDERPSMETILQVLRECYEEAV